MSLSNAMQSSVSGLGTASAAISVIGDNIANVSTPGFKERRAEFSDALGRAISTSGGFAQTGSGSRVANVSQIFSQGGLESTSRETDLAIEGQGFFILDDDQGRVYSRAGQFSFDNLGNLVDPFGRHVQGFELDPATELPTGQLSDVRIDTSVSAPQQTRMIDVSLNLDADVALVGPFDPANAIATSNFVTKVSVFDSLGSEHETSLFFTRTGENAWEWNAGLSPAVEGDPYDVQGTGALAFNAFGTLTSGGSSTSAFDFGAGAQPGQNIELNFGPTGLLGSASTTTQFADTPSVVNAQSQDGYGAGTLQSLAIGSEGFLSASFSNGVTRPISQVALATFSAVEGLDAVGNNAFAETRDSGQPLVGEANSGQFGSIRSNSVEQSNVDLAAQFIRLIMNQRAFQANTRTVSTTNELMANLVQLGQ